MGMVEDSERATMEDAKTPSLEERFRKLYANLPINVRADIVALIGKEPISWNLAFREIENNTERGKQVLQKLAEMEII